MKVFKVEDKVSFKKYKGDYNFADKSKAIGTIIDIQNGLLIIKIEDDSFFRNNPYCFTPKESQTLTKIRR